jgi:hypothetical protein
MRCAECVATGWDRGGPGSFATLAATRLAIERERFGNRGIKRICMAVDIGVRVHNLEAAI